MRTDMGRKLVIDALDMAGLKRSPDSKGRREDKADFS